MKTAEITIKEEISPIIKKAEALTITDPKSMTVAVEMLSQLNKKADEIEAEKSKVMRPLLDAQKAERARWKPLETILESAIATVRKSISVYQTETTRQAQEKADKITARVGEGKGKLKFETASDKIQALDTPDEKVTSESGSISFRTVERFEIEDLSKVPLEYHLADEKAIREAMKNGTKLPGIRYFSEEMPINSR